MTKTPIIAVVNNEPAIREHLCRELELAGYEVRSFASASDALELIGQPVDLALLDGSNPPLGGAELFRRLRGQTNMPVIFVSAWVDEISETLRAEGMPAEGYVDLPFSRNDLLKQVKVALSDL